MKKKIRQFFRALGDEDYEDYDEIEEEKIELATKASPMVTNNSSESNNSSTPVHLSAFKFFIRDLPRLVSRKNNHYRVRRKNQHIIKSSLLDFTSIYHVLISWSWWKLLILIIVGHLILHLIFALLYFVAGKDTIGGLNPDFDEGDYTAYGFLQCFFFSVQTMFTIGYGGLYPKSIYANSLVVAQSFLGLFTSTIVVTLSVAKFSRPTKLRKRIFFSKNAVINHVGYFSTQEIYNDISQRGQVTVPLQPFKDTLPMYLIFRFVNTRKTQFISTKFRLLLVEWKNEDERVEYEKSRTQHANEVLQKQEIRIRRNRKAGLVQQYIENSTGSRPLQSDDYSVLNIAEDALLYQGSDNVSETSALTSFWRKKSQRVGVYPVVHELYFQINNQTGKCMDIDLSAPLLCLPFTVVHPITSDSPLYPLLTSSEFNKTSRNTEIVACFEAVDEATSANVQARYSYTMNDILLDHEFTSCVFRNDKDELEIDYDALSSVRPIKL
nr:unnamed protein product [Naegleria fowleri]